MRSFLANVFLFIAAVLFLGGIYCRYERPLADYMDLLFFGLAASGISCALNAGNPRQHIHQHYGREAKTPPTANLRRVG